MIPTVAAIQTAVAKHYGISLMDMKSGRRAPQVTHPRQLAMYLARQLTPRSFPEIGRLFGNRDHTTVMHAVRVVEQRTGGDAALRLAVDRIRASLVPTHSEEDAFMLKEMGALA